MKLKDSEQFYRKNNSFFKLMFANSISRFGDSIDMVAFAWLTYQITNSETWSAIVVGVNQLVTILCQPIVGSIVENINKKNENTYYCKTGKICNYYYLFLIDIFNNTSNYWLA